MATMMTVLLESHGARGPRRAGWTVASVSVHAALIVGAIMVTAQAPDIASFVAESYHPVLPILPPEAPQPTPSQPTEPIASGAPSIPAIPIKIPAVPTFDVTRAFTRTAAGTEIFDRPSGPIVPMVIPPGAGVHTSGGVDRIAAPLPGNGAPDYPRSLRTAGVEGSVLVTFVVDTAGRAEPGSVRVVSNTHPLFAEAVRQWLGRTRYAPAEIRGMRVRQLVQQEVGFTLK
jgi:TonB family protein